jgi:hypothetical protein
MEATCIGKNAALVLIFVFLTASCLTVAKPVSSSADTAEDTWVEKASMPTARGGLGVVVVDGKIYAIGGASSRLPDPSGSSGILGTNEMYDPATDKWVSKAPMRTPRAYFAIAAFQGKIYCMGGQVGWYQEPTMDYLWGPKTTLNVEVYDVAKDTWSTLSPMPFGSFYGRASVINDKIYVVGPSITSVFDPSTGSWNRTKTMPIPTGGAWAKSLPVASIGQTILATGQLGSRILVYNTTYDSWSEGTLGPSYIDDGVGVATNGVNASIRFYIMGYSPQGSYAYDPQTGTWTNTSALPHQRTEFGLAVVNDVIYAIGGFTTGLNEAYFPLGYGTPDPAYVLENYPPNIVIEQPLNQTYSNSSVSLAFFVDKPVTWAGYSLDGRQNITINGNTTITHLSTGHHNLTVYANDTYGNMGTSETVNFAISESEPFPFVPVAAASAGLLIVVAVALVMCFRKRKR